MKKTLEEDKRRRYVLKNEKKFQEDLKRICEEKTGKQMDRW